MPVIAMCSRGRLTPSDTFPSFSTITMRPLSAMTAFAPVIPASTSPKNSATTSRTARERRTGSSSGTSSPAPASSSRMRARFRCSAGAVMWLGPRPSMSTMYSPMSVSSTSLPRTRRACVSPTSSATIDFDFAIRRASPSSCVTSATASSAVAAR